MENPSLSLNDTGRIYLDHNATTAPDAGVLEHLSQWANQWGNPSSIHQSGRGPKTLLREARMAVAGLLRAHPLEIIFTSGGSEANNQVIKSFDPADSQALRKEFITTKVEHPSVLKSFEYIRSRGGIIHYVDINREGQMDLEQYEKLLNERTALVSIMAANNETGAIFPIKKMVKKAHAVGAKFHTDAVQCLGKMPINLTDWEVDFATFSGHKIYALKGVGVVFSRRGQNLQSLISGGGQERGRRAGTENILSISALGHIAREQQVHFTEYFENMKALRDEFETQILARLPSVKITGAESKRLPNTSSLLIDGIDGESLLMNLDLEGVSVSTGAACSSGSPEPSHVLLAMGLSRQEAQRSLRVSLGWRTTQAEINKFIEILIHVVERLRKFQADSEVESEDETKRKIENI